MQVIIEARHSAPSGPVCPNHAAQHPQFCSSPTSVSLLLRHLLKITVDHLITLFSSKSSVLPWVCASARLTGHELRSCSSYLGLGISEGMCMIAGKFQNGFLHF